MRFEFLPPAVFCAIGGLGLLWTLYSWYQDYQFYKVRNWNFEEDSGRELRYGSAGMRLGKMSNVVRVTQGYPVCAIIFSGFLIFGSLPFLFEGKVTFGG